MFLVILVMPPSTWTALVVALFAPVRFGRWIGLQFPYQAPVIDKIQLETFLCEGITKQLSKVTIVWPLLELQLPTVRQVLLKLVREVFAQVLEACVDFLLHDLIISLLLGLWGL